MRVECACLPGQRVDDVRMAVTHHWDIVVGVEIGSALLVIHPDALGAHDLQRLLVKEPVGGGKHPRHGVPRLLSGQRAVESSNPDLLEQRSVGYMKSRAHEILIERLEMTAGSVALHVPFVNDEGHEEPRRHQCTEQRSSLCRSWTHA